MKLNGIVGKGTGKLGASVFAISGGEQIVRQYNPVVSNPNTDAQVAQRAKLKLMSQLAADLAQSLGFQKKGLVSARNQFISANIGFCTVENGEASVPLLNLDLTGGSARIPVPAEGSSNEIHLSAAAPANVASVYYAIYQEGMGSQLTLVSQELVTEAGDNRDFPTQMTIGDGSYIIYAYAVMGNGSASLVDYADYSASIADIEAILSYLRKVRVNGGTLSATTGFRVTA